MPNPNREKQVAALIISIIILIIVIILMIIMCCSWNQQNSQQNQPIIKNPQLLAAAAIYNKKRNNNNTTSGGTSNNLNIDCPVGSRVGIVTTANMQQKIQTCVPDYEPIIDNVPDAPVMNCPAGYHSTIANTILGQTYQTCAVDKSANIYSNF
jgi:hypothetical protein